MATDPRIILGYRPAQINTPGELMALKNISREAQYKHSVLKYDVFNNVKKTALSAYEQAVDAPEPVRQQRYREAWINYMDDIERSGMASAAGFSPEEIQAGRSNIVPPEVARASAVSLADIGKKEREQTEFDLLRLKRGNEAAETQRRIEKDRTDRAKAQQKEQTQQGGQLYFAAFQQAIANGADDAQADIMARQALANAGPQAASFDPDTLAITDEGDFIKTGGLVQTAKPKGLPREPGEMPELDPLGPKLGTGEDYDWRKAYLYNASINSKFNPQTAKTLIDYRTGRVVPNEPVLRASERVAKAGASNVQVGWDKPTTTQLQKGEIDIADGIKRLEGVKKSFDPSYLTLGKQWGSIISAAKEKIGIELGPKEQKALTEFTTFRRRTLSNINLYIKAITGAQMTIGEADRIQAALPNMEDSPSQFKSKLDDVIDELQDKLEAYDRLLKGGPNAILPATAGNAKAAPAGKVAPKETWSSDDQKRLEELERKYGK